MAARGKNRRFPTAVNRHAILARPHANRAVVMDRHQRTAAASCAARRPITRAARRRKRPSTSRVIQIRQSPRYRVSRSTAFNKLFAMRESVELRSRREGRWPRRRAFLGAGVYAGAKASLKRGQRRSNCKADHIWLGGAVQFRTPRRKFSGLPGRPLAGI